MDLTKVFNICLTLSAGGMSALIVTPLLKKLLIDIMAAGFISTMIIEELKECDKDCLKHLKKEMKSIYGEDSYKHGRLVKYPEFLELLYQYDELSPYMEVDFSFEIKLFLAARKSFDIMKKIINKVTFISFTICMGITVGFAIKMA